MLFADEAISVTIRDWVHICGAIATVLTVLGALHVYFSRFTTEQKTTSTKVDNLDKTVTTFIVRTDSAIAEQSKHHHELRSTVENHTGRLGRIEGVLEKRQ